MGENIKFYNEIYYMINGGILGNFVGVLHYVYKNKKNVNIEEMINNGVSFAMMTVCLVYLIYKIKIKRIK
jgi:hypothetical protein